MRIERMPSISGYSFNITGNNLDTYELREDCLPQGLNEIKILGRVSQADPWAELLRMGNVTQLKPYVALSDEKVLTFGENAFAHYSTSTAVLEFK